MRVRILSVLAATAMTVAIASSFAPAAGASAARPTTPGFAHRGVVHAAPQGIGAVLYDQYDNDTGVGISSQNFEATYDAYDDSGADDFKVPAGEVWKVKKVNVAGAYYNGTGPCRDETVTFYKNSGGAPGVVKATVTVAGLDTGGSFAIPTAVKLKGGANGKTYWVGVVCNMDFGVGGQWGWETRSVQNGNTGKWINPGNGFGTGCTTWTDVQTCVGYGPDWVFSLLGKKA
jgi:hypothetical protein